LRARDVDFASGAKNLEQTMAVERQQQHVQDQHRIDLHQRAIGHEEQTGGDRREPQRDHGARRIGGQGERRGHPPDQVETDHARPPFIAARNAPWFLYRASTLRRAIIASHVAAPRERRHAKGPPDVRGASVATPAA
jgi:hypothetical protein